jgi:hypothetical protein
MTQEEFANLKVGDVIYSPLKERNVNNYVWAIAKIEHGAMWSKEGKVATVPKNWEKFKSENICEWKHDGYSWDTGCDKNSEIKVAIIRNGRFIFCPYCGGKINEVKQ